MVNDQAAAQAVIAQVINLHGFIYLFASSVRRSVPQFNVTLAVMSATGFSEGIHEHML